MITFKRYLISSLYTFLAGFIPVVWISLESVQENWSMALQASFWVGVGLVALRAGVKAVGEFLAPQVPILIKWLKEKAK